jgi:iron(III) transport system substrate-binding protein
MKRVFAAALSYLAVTISGSAMAAPPDYYPADYQKIIDGSKTESGVLVYSNTTLANWKPILAAFNKEYPWIKVETTDLNANEVFERFYADTASNIAAADMILSAAPLEWLKLLPKNLIQDYVSPEAAKLPKWSMPAPGVYTLSTEPFLIVYNKLLLTPDEYPKSIQDIVNLAGKRPDLNHRMGTFSPNASAYAQGIYWGIMSHSGDKALEWFKKIGPMSDVYRAAGPIVEKITSGEYLIGYNVSSSVFSRQLTDDVNKQKIIGWALPADGVVLNMRNMALPKKTKSPNSAKLLLDFIISKNGQTAVGMGGLCIYRADVDNPGSKLLGLSYDAIQKQVGAENITPISLDPKMLTDMQPMGDKLEALFKR